LTSFVAKKPVQRFIFFGTPRNIGGMSSSIFHAVLQYHTVTNGTGDLWERHQPTAVAFIIELVPGGKSPTYHTVPDAR
jgi:hypothetical protein